MNLGITASANNRLIIISNKSRNISKEEHLWIQVLWKRVTNPVKY